MFSYTVPDLWLYLDAVEIYSQHVYAGPVTRTLQVDRKRAYCAFHVSGANAELVSQCLKWWSVSVAKNPHKRL